MQIQARSLSELDRECILGKGFFSPPGGVEFEFDAAAARSKSSSNCSGASSKREVELCHRQFELEFEHVDRESGLRKLVFFFPGGGCEFEFEFDADAARSKSSSNCSGASSNASSKLCHRQFELEFEHMDRESGLRKLGFFFRGGGVPVRVRVRAGLTMQDTKPGCSRSKSQEDHGIEWQRLSELRTLSCRHQTQ